MAVVVEPGERGPESALADTGGRGRRSRAEFKAEQAKQAAGRRRMAWATAGCLLALVAGAVAERFTLAPRGLVIAIYLASYLAGGLDTLARSIRELARGELNVDLLMISAAVGAAAVGAWAEGAVLLFLFALSHTLEAFILGGTRRAIAALMDLSPERATARRDGAEVTLAVEDLRPGDLVIVRPGERIPTDGRIEAGRTGVDQAAVTGESIPVEKGPGDSVFAGTLNQSGAIEVRVDRAASESTLARIAAMVEEAQGRKAESERFTDWFGSRYTRVVLLGTLVVLLVPIVGWGEPFNRAFYRAMTAMVVASPCAVVISIPAAILSAIAGAARRGVLFKGGTHLERAAALRAIAFDKTGTLTLGQPRLVDLVAGDGVEPDALLRLAAAAESLSEHPLARAVIDEAKARGLEVPAGSDFQALIGRGLTARVEGRLVRVGKPGLFGGELSGPLAEAAESLAGQGKTILVVGDESGPLGVLAVADTLRPGTAEAVASLRALGLERLEMLTGDHEGVARAIAGSLGLEYRAELMPQDKLEEIRRLRGQFVEVAMVGDGINDAPSLAEATLGVAIGTGGTDVALETADVVLMAGDLRHLPWAIEQGRAAGAVIRQNLTVAFGTMATLLVATFAVDLPLPLGVLGHEGSTVLVILNGLRLLARPAPGHTGASAATAAAGETAGSGSTAETSAPAASA